MLPSPYWAAFPERNCCGGPAIAASSARDGGRDGTLLALRGPSLVTSPPFWAFSSLLALNFRARVVCRTDVVRIARRVLAFPFIVMAAVFALLSALFDGLAAAIEPRDRPPHRA